MNTLYLLAAISLIISLSAYSTADETEEPLIVTLATESSTVPLYLLPFTSDQSDLDSAYIRQLEQVLTYDLNHNGSTSVVKRQPEKDQIGLAGPFAQMGSSDSWKANHIYYVIKAQVQGRSLAVLMLDVQSKTLKSADPLPLIGDLAQDRRQVHRLADTIHKSLFGTEGIASTRLLYTVTTRNSNDSTKWITEIWEADYDGANARQLTKDKSVCIAPVYLPPKPGFATGGFLYTSYKLGQPKIYIATLKDGIGQRLMTLRGSQLMPAVSQQRDKIAFISDVTGNPDLFLQPFSPETGTSGKPQQIFSARQATQGTPTFSPDGKRIAFVSNKDGSPKIYVITIPSAGTSLNDIKATLISKSNRENTAPTWSPDGTKIAYCSRSKGDRQIWMYDYKTNKETQITQGPGNKENPSWAPNSMHLVYNSSDNDKSELFMINLNQPEPTQITLGSGEKRFPNWEPRTR